MKRINLLVAKLRATIESVTEKEINYLVKKQTATVWEQEMFRAHHRGLLTLKEMVACVKLEKEIRENYDQNNLTAVRLVQMVGELPLLPNEIII
jgi:hypothetical protein